MDKIRVRFAPSPTGPLHIGGVRTALYNYLFAKKHNGTFILRVEDTDQNRYVEGAEAYIVEALEWLGLSIDEGPQSGGEFGPYRQSERKAIYKKYAEELIKNGKAYYAFDSPEELNKAREVDPNFKYGSTVRGKMNNSLTQSPEATESLINGQYTVVRLKFPEKGEITFDDEVRGQVTFQASELDDKVILKADGMPTYHLANIVDDHLMKISHVIRGEEWLSSTAHHVFMYDALSWERPTFAHLPLILKPSGKGKLSKRDGAKFGIPVFPINWDAGDELYPGFREDGYLPNALLNFLAFLGWSPKSDQEIFSLDELIEAFSLEAIVKSGARFDVDKALWYNQQYIIQSADRDLALRMKSQANELKYDVTDQQLERIANLMKERVHKVDEILVNGYYLVKRPASYDEKIIRKKYKEENIPHYIAIADKVKELNTDDPSIYADAVKGYIQDEGLGMGAILPIMRIALTGTMAGPDLFETFAFLGGEESATRIINLTKA